MLATVYSGSLVGLDTHLVRVEVDISRGLPAFNIVGLPDTSVQESRERVRAAIRNAGLEFPIRRITVNLSPADLRKEGPSFDLPIALGILAASGQVPERRLEDLVAVGELALDGTTRRVRGVLSMVCDLPVLEGQAARGALRLMVPGANGPEAAAISAGETVLVSSLRDAVGFLEGALAPRAPAPRSPESGERPLRAIDLADVHGQQFARRALEIAAAGDHHLLLSGPPGSGKTMLAERLSTILPELTDSEAIEVTKIYSVAGLLREQGSLLRERPFRSPHHTISDVALVGGGKIPRPGEISLAHRGVLFLDELTEFRRSTLEVLRQPLADRKVHICRARGAACYPADFLLIATMNPCPCGYRGDSSRTCTCSHRQLDRYLAHISGPLLDRIDLHVDVPRLGVSALRQQSWETSAAVRRRVDAARAIQAERLSGARATTNGRMDVRLIGTHCEASGAAVRLLEAVAETQGVTARSYHNTLKVARTVADLSGCATIGEEHVAEAVQFRSLDTARGG